MPATSTVAHPSALIAAALVEATGDVLFVAADEQRAEQVSAIAAGLAPDLLVAHLPSSDALPGDDAPASPANVGRRVAALRRVRAALSGGEDRPRVVLVTTAEATAVRVPEPAAYDAAPPHIEVGDAIDLDAFAAAAADAGYFIDDRVDEPGEIAIRGQVVDIFPADHLEPVRIEIADGTVTAIRRYDPVSQRSTEDLASVELGRAAEPPCKATESILSHLPGAALLLDPSTDARRQRFLAIAGERAGRRRVSWSGAGPRGRSRALPPGMTVRWCWRAARATCGFSHPGWARRQSSTGRPWAVGRRRARERARCCWKRRSIAGSCAAASRWSRRRTCWADARAAMRRRPRQRARCSARRANWG